MGGEYTAAQQVGLALLVPLVDLYQPGVGSERAKVARLQPGVEASLDPMNPRRPIACHLFDHARSQAFRRNLFAVRGLHSCQIACRFYEGVHAQRLGCCCWFLASYGCGLSWAAPQVCAPGILLGFARCFRNATWGMRDS